MKLAFVNDDIFFISCEYDADCDGPSLRHTSELIGAYVTAGARNHLYRYFDRLRENAMYCDTNFFLYIQPEGEGTQLIDTGFKLWERNSELRHLESVSEFVSGVAKNYA